MQAEYQAACDVVREIVWLRQLLKELGHEQQHPTVVFEDNHGCISLTENNRTDPRTKHIDVKYHYTREQVANKVVKFAPIPTAVMVADALTKPAPVPKFKWCREHMGIKDVSDQMLPTSVRGGVSRLDANIGIRDRLQYCSYATDKHGHTALEAATTHDRLTYGNSTPVVHGDDRLTLGNSATEFLGI